MKTYALIGRTLAHSWSPSCYSALFARDGIADARYLLHETDTLDGLRQWVRREAILGFNVTIPYKEQIIPLLDALSPTARAVGAVNCVDCRGGLLAGHNTDSPAFARTLTPLLRPWHTQALLLGTGGAAQAVSHALHSLGIPFTTVSRTPEAHPGSVPYSQIPLLASTHLIIINATPVGMYPRADASPLPDPRCITPRHLCYDLVYNPSPTLFLRQASDAGASVADGLAMLRLQAELSWQIFTRSSPSA